MKADVESRIQNIEFSIAAAICGGGLHHGPCLFRRGFYVWTGIGRILGMGGIVRLLRMGMLNWISLMNRKCRAADIGLTVPYPFFVAKIISYGKTGPEQGV